MTSPSDEQLREWIQSISKKQQHKISGSLTDRVDEKTASRIVQIAREEAIRKYQERMAKVKLSAAYEVAKRDVADVLRRYTPAEPVTGYINVFGWYAR